MILENSFIRTSKYGGGAVDVYQGSWKIVRAWEGQDGKVRADWVYPQKNRKPATKAIPAGVDLGDEKQKAIAVLKTWIKLIEASEAVDYPDTARAPDEGTIGEHYTDKQDDYGEDIPF